MAFKMNRPKKLKGPKKSVLNLGRAKNKSGIYYNSKMGPMLYTSPSALKQAEEGMGDMGGMEAMMGMMGGAPEKGVADPTGAPAEKEKTEKMQESWSFDETDLQGGDMGEVKKDEATGMLYVIVENEDELIADLGQDIKVMIPPNIVKQANAKVGELLTGGDYQVQLNSETNEYEIQTMNEESQEEAIEKIEQGEGGESDY
tara:strand:- start:512 stop:1114 length:603 start_codon:yes stop_codon:yes gene_type:complete